MIKFRELIAVIWAALTAFLIFAIIVAAFNPEVGKDTMCFLFLGLIAGVLTTIALAQD
jgi:hypothetical protein